LATAAKSLRVMVENWLAPFPETPIRVTEFRKRHWTGDCYVRVETQDPSGPVSMLFFRHRNGSWCVFPASPEKPAMRFERH